MMYLTDYLNGFICGTNVISSFPLPSSVDAGSVTFCPLQSFITEAGNIIVYNIH